MKLKTFIAVCAIVGICGWQAGAQLTGNQSIALIRLVGDGPSIRLHIRLGLHRKMKLSSLSSTAIHIEKFVVRFTICMPTATHFG